MIKTTQRYSHLMPGVMQKASDVMTDLVEKAKHGPDPPTENIVDLEEHRRRKA